MNLLRSTAFALAVATVLWAAPSFAGHYELVDVDFVTAGERDILGKQGIRTTIDLLDHVDKKAEREALAKATKIAADKIEAWSRICDLLRVEGVGPKMVMLLTLAGVPDVATLQKETPEGLLPRADAANSKYRITEKPPGLANFRAWIDSAKALPIILE